MPSSHRRYASWTPARMLSFAAGIGPGTAALVETIMQTKPHPEQGFRACLGILQAACQRGLSIGSRSYGSIASILRNGLDRAFHEDPPPDPTPLLHANIRGRGYYH